MSHWRKMVSSHHFFASRWRRAQEAYPKRPVKMLVPFTPDGMDPRAHVAAKLAERWNIPWWWRNRPGPAAISEPMRSRRRRPTGTASSPEHDAQSWALQEHPLRSGEGLRAAASRWKDGAGRPPIGEGDQRPSRGVAANPGASTTLPGRGTPHHLRWSLQAERRDRPVHVPYKGSGPAAPTSGGRSGDVPAAARQPQCRRRSCASSRAQRSTSTSVRALRWQARRGRSSPLSTDINAVLKQPEVRDGAAGLGHRRHPADLARLTATDPTAGPLIRDARIEAE